MNGLVKVKEVKLSGNRMAMFFRFGDFIRCTVFHYTALGLPVQHHSRRKFVGGE